MKKEILDLSKERELLTTVSKRIWDNVVKDTEIICKKLGLNQKQKNAILQRAMADIRIADMKKINEYLSRTDDSSAKEAIKKNKVRIVDMEYVYNENLKETQELNEEIEKMQMELIASRENKQTNKNDK